MNEQHIIENLDARPFAELGENELSQIKAHCAHCGECRIAFQAARRSAAILKFEAENSPEPAPFFSARVMNALKEQRGKRGTLQPVWDLWKMWQASGALVSVMVAMVAALFFAGAIAPNASNNMAQPVTADTAEAVLFEQDNTLKDATTEQIFQEIYER